MAISFIKENSYSNYKNRWIKYSLNCQIECKNNNKSK